MSYHRENSFDHLDPDLMKSVDHSFFDSDDEGGGERNPPSPERSASRRCDDRRSVTPPMTPADGGGTTQKQQTNDVAKSLRESEVKYSENFEADNAASSLDEGSSDEDGRFRPMKYSEEGSKGGFSSSNNSEISRTPPLQVSDHKQRNSIDDVDDDDDDDDESSSLSQSGSGSMTDVSPLDSPRFSPIPWRDGENSLVTASQIGTPSIPAHFNTRKPIDLLQLQDIEDDDGAGPSEGHRHVDTLASKYHYRCGHNRHLIDPNNDRMDVNRLLKEVLRLEDDQISRTSSKGSRSSGLRKPFLVNAHLKPRSKKNLSFSNIRTRDVDHENKRLLKQILNPPRKHVVSSEVLPQGRAKPSSQKHHTSKTSSSAINRYNSQRKIEHENKSFLRRLEHVRPSTELERDSLMKEHESQVKHHLNVSRAHRPPEGVLIISPTSSRPGSIAGERAPSVSSVRSAATSQSSLRKHSSRTVSSSPHSRYRPRPKPAWDDRFSYT